jgi:hypothetical protein
MAVTHAQPAGACGKVFGGGECLAIARRHRDLAEPPGQPTRAGKRNP